MTADESAGARGGGSWQNQVPEGTGQGVPRPGASQGLEPLGCGGENSWLQDSRHVCVSGVGEESGQSPLCARPAL